MYFAYLLANESTVALYTGVSNDLIRRVYEHKQQTDLKSFTARYHIHKLVCYEACTDVRAAIEREKQIKGWNRKRKNALVDRINPLWEDLYETLF